MMIFLAAGLALCLAAPARAGQSRNLAAETVAASGYNQKILKDHPVLFLAMDTPGRGVQIDLSGHGRNGAYKGGTPRLATLPNGDKAADFNGSSEYVTVRSVAALSVPTSGAITIEAWIKPDTLQFPHTEAGNYVYFLGKGDSADGYEYANRMYSLKNPVGRPNRISVYAWDPAGGLGSGSYFEDAVTAGDWIMVTDVIDMKDTSPQYPTGYISIYKNGVLRQKVPLSMYHVIPKATDAPLNIGSRNFNSWFKGAVGKVAVYNHVLNDAQIISHFAAMWDVQLQQLLHPPIQRDRP